ncbi:TadE/TadG family type IV pilus assembly protein [Ferrimonas balearica]|uniref:TadE/TadG family type IV pilus assembly protein n=1 Tax=Ferrimonas balearica TaxID=44012 RepID=UPI001C9924CE|nr:TadE family protein [Ferrimonas balearica]MBY5992033.1 pilus assembly protein [Ferrimonas balearica]
MKRRQSGVYVVEFAIVATVVFTMLFACLEVARLMYSYNVLTEASRRVARLAVVCSPDLTGAPAATANMINLALFDGENLVGGLDASNVTVEYLDDAGAAASALAFVRYVRASISNYQHELFIPGLVIQISSPAFTTVLPAESLGQTRFGVTTYCS